MGTRTEKVANALKKEVSQIINNELKDPRLGFITITKVKVSEDLKHATIFFSVLGDEKSKKNSRYGLDSAKGYIQYLLGERLELRFTPQIIFKLDETSEFIQRMDKILGEDKDRQANT